MLTPVTFISIHPLQSGYGNALKSTIRDFQPQVFFKHQAAPSGHIGGTPGDFDSCCMRHRGVMTPQCIYLLGTFQGISISAL